MEVSYSFLPLVPYVGSITTNTIRENTIIHHKEQYKEVIMKDTAITLDILLYDYIFL